MKGIKNIAILTALSALLLGAAGCVKNNPDTPQDGDILFSASIGEFSLTKGNIIQSTEELRSGGALSLYGYTYLNGSTSPTIVIENSMLSYSGGKWDYAPHQYWVDSAPKYTFLGIYPYFVARDGVEFVPADDPATEVFTTPNPTNDVIAVVNPVKLYLTDPMDDILMGSKNVLPAAYHSTVTIPVNHTACAVRFRVRNLSQNDFCLTNWYMTGIKTCADMVSLFASASEENEPRRLMSLVEDSRISSIDLTADADKYVVIPSIIKSGTESAVQAKYPNYYARKSGNQIPFIYEKEAKVFDFNNDGLHNQSDMDRNIRQFECLCHMFGTNQVNGGLKMPISADIEANLYSPYYFNVERHTAGSGSKWQEGTALSAGSSIYTWTANNGSPVAPITLTTTAPSSKCGQEFNDVLNDDGYLLLLPQDLDDLQLHFSTATYSGSTYGTVDERSVDLAYYTSDGKWKMGYMYDYLITVTTDKIMVTLEVAPWKDRDISLN